MKFTCTTQISLPIDKVFMLFEDTENLKEWQDGFISYEHLSGIKGDPGSKSKFVYKSGNSIIELTETLLTRTVPNEVSMLFEHKQMVNSMTNRFRSVDENTTIYEAEIEYTQFIGIMPKLIAFLMPGVFRKQTQKWLDQFKVFAEKRK